MTIAAIIKALGYLPELLRIYQAVESSRRYTPEQSDYKKRKLKEDLNELEQAIKEKDATKVNDLFNDLDR